MVKVMLKDVFRPAAEIYQSKSSRPFKLKLSQVDKGQKSSRVSNAASRLTVVNQLTLQHTPCFVVK
jgi:hypothetical protein